MFNGRRKTIQQLASRYELHPNQISIWKRHFLEGSEGVFEENVQSKDKESEQIQEKLYKKYPDLLRRLKIDGVNQEWATDISWIPIKQGFMYLIAIIDLYSRYVLNWSISNSMDATCCADVLKEAIKEHGTPESFNTDQGSEFTSLRFTDILKANPIQISMDGKGRAIDNVFIERLWRSVKTE